MTYLTIESNLAEKIGFTIFSLPGEAEYRSGRYRSAMYEAYEKAVLPADSRGDYFTS